MFIIHGIREKIIKSYPDKISTCTHCQKKTLFFEVSQEYCHLFWIPVFPWGKKEITLICKNCNRYHQVGERGKLYLSDASTPLYLFTGTILIISFLTIQRPYYLEQQQEKLNYASNPQINDVYKIEAKELVYGKTKYEYFRVVDVKNDSIYTYKNTLKYGKILDVFQDEDYFIAKKIGFHHNDLNALLKRGKLDDIERGYDDQIGYHRTKPQ